MNNYYNDIKARVRELRKNQTPEEQIIWGFVRNRRLGGVNFFRQHPILYNQSNQTHFFIADFYSKEASLVVEIDGKIHERQKEYDKQRDLILREKNLQIVRITNHQVKNNLEQVLELIQKAASRSGPLSVYREG